MKYLRKLLFLLLCLILAGCTGKKNVLSDLCPADRESVTCIDLRNQKGSCCMGNPDYLTKTWDLLDNIEYSTEMQTAAYDPMAAYPCLWFFVGDDPTRIYLAEDFSQWIPELDPEAETYQYHSIRDPKRLQEFFETHIATVYNREVTAQSFAQMGQPYAWMQGLTADAMSQVRLGYSNSTGSSSGLAISAVAFEELRTLLKAIPEDALANPEIIGESGKDHIGVRYSDHPNLAVSFLDQANDLGVVVRYYEEADTTPHLEFLMVEGADKLSPDNHEYIRPVQKWDIESPALQDWFRKMEPYPPYAQMVTGHWLDFDRELLTISDGESTLRLRTITGWTYEVTEPEVGGDSFGVRFRPHGETEGWIYLSFWPSGYENQEINRYLNHNGSGYTSFPLTVLYPNGMDVSDAEWSVTVDHYENGDYAVINENAGSWFTRYADDIYVQRIYRWVEAGESVNKEPPEMVVDLEYTQSADYEEGFKQFDLKTADRAYLSLSGWEECGWVHDDTQSEENILLTYWPQYETEGLVCVEYHEGFFQPPEDMIVEETTLHIDAYGGANPAYRGTMPGDERWSCLWIDRKNGSYVFRFENTEHWTERKAEECLWALHTLQFRG